MRGFIISVFQCKGPKDQHVTSTAGLNDCTPSKVDDPPPIFEHLLLAQTLKLRNYTILNAMENTSVRTGNDIEIIERYEMLAMVCRSELVGES